MVATPAGGLPLALRAVSPERGKRMAHRHTLSVLILGTLLLLVPATARAQGAPAVSGGESSRITVEAPAAPAPPPPAVILAPPEAPLVPRASVLPAVPSYDQQLKDARTLRKVGIGLSIGALVTTAVGWGLLLDYWFGSISCLLRCSGPSDGQAYAGVTLAVTGIGVGVAGLVTGLVGNYRLKRLQERTGLSLQPAPAGAAAGGSLRLQF
jgi:hypothetical protein